MIIRKLIFIFLTAVSLCAGSVWAAGAAPEVYGFRVEKISRDDDAYRQGSLYLLTGPDGKEQYIIVRDINGGVAIIKRETGKK